MINFDERMLPTRRGSNPQPPDHQHPAKPPRPAFIINWSVKLQPNTSNDPVFGHDYQHPTMYIPTKFVDPIPVSVEERMDRNTKFVPRARMYIPTKFVDPIPVCVEERMDRNTKFVPRAINLDILLYSVQFTEDIASNNSFFFILFYFIYLFFLFFLFFFFFDVIYHYPET